MTEKDAGRGSPKASSANKKDSKKVEKLNNKYTVLVCVLRHAHIKSAVYNKPLINSNTATMYKVHLFMIVQQRVGQKNEMQVLVSLCYSQNINYING